MTVHANGWSGTHEAELEVTIQYPRIRGIITLVEVISIFVVLDFLFGALLLFFFPPRRPTFVPSLFCSVLIVSFTWYLWFTVRNIESVFTTFRISPMQLVVENSRLAYSRSTGPSSRAPRTPELGSRERRLRWRLHTSPSLSRL